MGKSRTDRQFIVRIVKLDVILEKYFEVFKVLFLTDNTDFHRKI